MTDFTLFSKAVHARFTELAQCQELFVSPVTGDELWDAYLAAFPEGSNPIFRERTEHDCSCCRNFIKNIGGVVAIIDGYVESVWGDLAEDLPHPYNVVAQALDKLIIDHPQPIASIYRTTPNLAQFGAEHNFEAVEGGEPIKWHHFHGKVPAKFVVASPASVIGDYNTSVQMFKRALGIAKDPETGRPLPGISPEAVATVLALIADNNLYRGEEKKHLVLDFQEVALRLASCVMQDREIVIALNANRPMARIRNDVIGTLLVDLSEGVELERAVKSFEDKVSGTNYKRPKALVTQRMIDDAVKTIEDLGIETALQRRHAKISDITINNVIWADRSAAQRMKGGVAGLLAGAAQPDQDNAQATPISIGDFMSSVVPTAEGIELRLAGGQQNKLMSLTAPVDPEAAKIFKWPNDFAWSYNGNITDSIKEKVKRAGGNTGAALRVSLAWFNGDDLDIHARCPDGWVYFGQPGGDGSQRFSSNRILDVDMNAGSPKNSKDPVENLSWTAPKDGQYQIEVYQYAKRTGDNPGFVLEVESEGVVTQYSYAKGLDQNARYIALQFKVKGGKIVELSAAKELVGGGLVSDVWGIKTETYVPVETLLFSPNHWDGHAVGNKHWFFILKGCKNPEPCRGIYNEFLIPELDAHRKVLEVLGGKTMCPVADEQLSGAGFSSTGGDKVRVRVVSGKQRRVYDVQF